MRIFAAFLPIAWILSATQAGATGTDVKSLPAAVQAAIRHNLTGEIRNIHKEIENGLEQYEVESLVDGKKRDFSVDSQGVLLVVETETTIDAVPSAAKAAILKKAGSGKVIGVETFSKPGQPMMYEATYTNEAGQKREVLVKADGTETKE